MHTVHPGQPVGQLAGQLGAVHAHADGEVLGGGVEFVEIVLPLIEVVAHFLVRHRDRPAAAAVGVPVLGRGRQLCGGQPVTPVQVDHRPGQRRMRADHVGDLGEVDVDVHVAVHGDLAQFGDQSGVVLGGEERCVDTEHLGDSQQHGHRQRANVMLDLIEVTRRDLQHLGQCRLAEPAFAAKLSHPRADKRFRHVRQPNNSAKTYFALLADWALWQDRAGGITGEITDMAGIAGNTGLAKVMMPVPDPHPDVFDKQWPLRVADIDREGRLRFDAATRHIQDVGSDHLRELGYEETHPLWIVRRTMIDLIKPVEFQDMLRLRRWCSGTSNRWCEMRVRIDGKRGRGLMESEAFWININRETQGPARISDDFIEGLQRTTDVDRLRWKAYLKAGSREDAAQIRDYPVRVSDIDIFDHMNNSVYWSVVEDYLFSNPELLHKPIRVTIEHDAAVALGDKLEIISHVHPAGSTEQFGAELADRTVRTLTYAVGDETKAVAAIFAL